CEFTPGSEYDYARMKVTINKVQEWPEYPDRDPGFNFRNLPEPYEIPDHIWEREIYYLKKLDSLIIIDRVDGFLPYDWNLHVLAESAKRNGNLVTFGCMEDIEMDVHLDINTDNGDIEDIIQMSEWKHHGLDETRIPLSWHEYTWMWDREISAMSESTKILRINMKSPSVTMAVLSARSKGEIPLKVSFNEKESAVRIKGRSGEEFILGIKGETYFRFPEGESND
ncbi:MAG: hypothetical protein JXN10_03090, partial [Clostridia bacterium]|nr:hypothetical protein [Clostridia bacterium]